MTSASEKALPIAIGILFVLLILMLLLRKLAKRIDGELLIIMCIGYGMLRLLYTVGRKHTIFL